MTSTITTSSSKLRRTFTEFITELRELEEKERADEKKVKDRDHRISYRRFLENDIKNDRLTFQTKWSDYVLRLKDTEAFYNLIGQEPSNPRDIFFDYLEELETIHRQVKSDFKTIFKNNLHLFKLGITTDEFVQQIKKFDQIAKLPERQLCNSINYYVDYLYRKLVKRQKKSVGKLIKFFYKANVDKNTELADLAEAINKHENSSYLNSIDETDKQSLLEQYQANLGDEETLIAFIRSKISSHKAKKERSSEPKTRRSKDKSHKRKHRRDKSQRSSSREKSESERRSDETEQGEIKNYNGNLLKKRSNMRRN
jgi:hypothetical protein